MSKTINVRSTGEGWQSRMDSVLKQYVSKEVKNTR